MYRQERLVKMQKARVEAVRKAKAEREIRALREAQAKAAAKPISEERRKHREFLLQNVKSGKGSMGTGTEIKPVFKPSKDRGGMLGKGFA